MRTPKFPVVFILAALGVLNAGCSLREPVSGSGWNNSSLCEIGGGNIKVDLKYCGQENLAGMAIYPVGFKAQLRPEAAAALERAAKRLKETGLHLVLLDAWRPPVSAAILSYKASERGAVNLVAHPEKSGHSRAISVDVTLEDLRTGRPVPMPGAYDQPWGAHTKWSVELAKAMREQGFTGCRGEWWHFDYKPFSGGAVVVGPSHFGRYSYSGEKLRITR